MSLTINQPVIAPKSIPPHRAGDPGQLPPAPRHPVFGSSRSQRSDQFIRLSSSDDLPSAARHAERISGATGTSPAQAPRKHTRVSLFGLPGLDLNLRTDTTKHPPSPGQLTGTKTKERYLSLDIAKLGGGTRRLWESSKDVRTAPRIGRPGPLAPMMETMRKLTSHLLPR
jgi:hypothetical protein